MNNWSLNQERDYENNLHHNHETSTVQFQLVLIVLQLSGIYSFMMLDASFMGRQSWFAKKSVTTLTSNTLFTRSAVNVRTRTRVAFPRIGKCETKSCGRQKKETEIF